MADKGTGLAPWGGSGRAFVWLLLGNLLLSGVVAVLLFSGDESAQMALRIRHGPGHTVLAVSPRKARLLNADGTVSRVITPPTDHRFEDASLGPSGFWAVLDRGAYLAHYDRTGKFTRKFPLGATTRFGPYIASMPPYIAVAVPDRHQVWLFHTETKEMTRLGRWGAGPQSLRFPTDVVEDEGRGLLVVDSGNRQIKRIDRKLRFSVALDLRARMSGKARPMTVAAASKGSRFYVVVADHGTGARASLRSWESNGEGSKGFRQLSLDIPKGERPPTVVALFDRLLLSSITSGSLLTYDLKGYPRAEASRWSAPSVRESRSSSNRKGVYIVVLAVLVLAWLALAIAFWALRDYRPDRKEVEGYAVPLARFTQDELKSVIKASPFQLGLMALVHLATAEVITMMVTDRSPVSLLAGLVVLVLLWAAYLRGVVAPFITALHLREASLFEAKLKIFNSYEPFILRALSDTEEVLHAGLCTRPIDLAGPLALIRYFLLVRERYLVLITNKRLLVLTEEEEGGHPRRAFCVGLGKDASAHQHREWFTPWNSLVVSSGGEAFRLALADRADVDAFEKVIAEVAAERPRELEEARRLVCCNCGGAQATGSELRECRWCGTAHRRWAESVALNLLIGGLGLFRMRDWVTSAVAMVVFALAGVAALSAAFGGALVPTGGAVFVAVKIAAVPLSLGLVTVSRSWYLGATGWLARPPQPPAEPE